MDLSERQFFLAVWALICATAITIFFLSFLYCYSVNRHIVQIVKQGATPIEARQALRYTSDFEDIMAWMDQNNKTIRK